MPLIGYLWSGCMVSVPGWGVLVRGRGGAGSVTITPSFLAGCSLGLFCSQEQTPTWAAQLGFHSPVSSFPEAWHQAGRETRVMSPAFGVAPARSSPSVYFPAAAFTVGSPKRTHRHTVSPKALWEVLSNSVSMAMDYVLSAATGLDGHHWVNKIRQVPWGHGGGGGSCVAGIQGRVDKALGEVGELSGLFKAG